MHSSKLVWGLVALSSIVVAGCGDDGATTGGGGNGGEATSGSPTSTTTTGTTAEGGGTGDGGSGAGGSTSEGGAGQGGSGGSDGCGDRILNGDEACDADDLGGATCIGLGFYFGGVTCSDDCELVTIGCAGPEVCDDGVDNDLDGAADCSDGACAADAACDDEGGTIEVSCSDIADNDDDDLVDCLDPDCQALAVCTPGDNAVGTPCTSNSQCASEAGNDPLCLSAALVDGVLPDGYCSESCDTVAQDCADGAVCIPGIFSGMCVDSCEDSGDCRDGYDCVTSGPLGLGSVCFAATPGNEVCDNDLDDDNDGDVDCADLSCAEDTDCGGFELECNNVVDDDEDDLVDCQDDSSCQGTAFCTPGDRPAGAPCSGHNECESPAGTPLCFPDLAYPGGYCSGFCEDAADCSDGASCIEGYCYQPCDALYACRPGYLCDRDLEVCAPLTDDELCGNLFDDNGDDLTDCDDPACAATVACTAPEDICDNLDDDDDDGLVDCADPSCAGNADCDAGDQDVGSACVVNTACAATGDDPFCISADVNFPGGYCSEWCDVIAQDCPSGAACLAVGDLLAGACFETCEIADDCREGYDCVDVDETVDGEQLVCQPAVE